jgi:hypothetical protein
MISEETKRERAEGQRIIAAAGLPSEQYIKASNLWNSAILLREKLRKHGMRLRDVEPEDIINWV